MYYHIIHPLPIILVVYNMSLMQIYKVKKIEVERNLQSKILMLEAQIIVNYINLMIWHMSEDYFGGEGVRGFPIAHRHKVSLSGVLISVANLLVFYK